MREIWRLKTKPGGATLVERRELIDAMLSEGFISTGWHVGRPPNCAQDYVQQLAAAHDKKLPQSARRFATEVQEADLVWIVDLEGLFHLARVSGPWYYAPETNRSFSLHAVNRYPCEWVAVGLKSSDVASGVRNGLTQGQTFCRIKDASALNFTRRISGDTTETSSVEFIHLIDHEALEDIVGIYLQSRLKGYIVPSSAKRSNAAYEFVVRSWDGSQEAVAQVKAGNNPIRDALPNVGCDRFLFALNGQYPEDLKGAIKIELKDLVEFALNNRNLLPRTVQAWISD